MSGITVKIEPDIINWLIKKLQFENTSSSVFDILEKWKSGVKNPTFHQVEDISKKTNIPLGYFFLQTPPQEECHIIEYRTIDSFNVQNPSRNLIDVVDSMTDVQEWMREYLKSNGLEPLDFVASEKDSENIIEIANRIRKKLGLELEWYVSSKGNADSPKLLRKTFENAGILVMMNGVVGQNTHRRLSLSEFRAFTLVDNYAPLIFINTCDSDTGKTFSLLHEMIHVWVGVNSFYNDKYGNENSVDKTEALCNAVAAEIIAPKNIFINKWEEKTDSTDAKVESLAKYFKCSRNVIARKALENNFLIKEEYLRIVNELIKQYENWILEKNEKKNPGGDYYKTMGTRLDHRFIQALANSAKEGKTQYTDVYRLTNMNRTTFAKLENEVGRDLW